MLSALAGILNALGENVEAPELSETAFSVVRKSSDRFALGHMLAGLAFNLTCINAWNRAEAAILESIDIARESNHIDALGHRLWIYGSVVLTSTVSAPGEIWPGEGLAWSREAGYRARYHRWSLPEPQRRLRTLRISNMTARIQCYLLTGARSLCATLTAVGGIRAVQTNSTIFST